MAARLPKGAVGGYVWPMADDTCTLFLPDDAATDALAARFAGHLRAGDCVALHGPIGAGKSHFARAFIRAHLGRCEDVPSPTFTLVQTYGAAPEVWHADLYRLSHPDEVLELGMDQALEQAICLIEWPERMGAALPADAIHLRLSVQGDGRLAQITLPRHPDLAAALRADAP